MTNFALFLVMGVFAAAATEAFRPLCDFDTVVRPWSTETAISPSVRFSREMALSGGTSLAVQMRREGAVLRATWGMDLFDVELSPETRFRFHVHGPAAAAGGPGQPHGGLILVEAGGAAAGRHSHWLLDTPGGIYTAGRWREFVTEPVSQAHSPEWARDVDGLIDFRRIERLVFVLQQESARAGLVPYTFYLDDLSATGWRVRETEVRLAENFSTPSHIRPVQRGFIGRKRERGRTITFSDVTGWRVIQYGGEAFFVRSEEEPLFGEPVGKLTYRSSAGTGYLRLEPPEPVPLRRFNAVLMWVFGNNWSWVPDPTTPQVLIALEIADPSGERHTIELDRVNWKFWSMMHKCVRRDFREDERHGACGGDADGILDFPATLTAIEIRGGSNTGFRSIYLDSIIFRNERTRLPEFRASLDGLPFPTTPDTILPSVIGQPVRNHLVRIGDGFHFTAKSDDGDLIYEYFPKTGTLSDLRVRLGRLEFTPCDGAGPEVDGRVVTANLVSADMIGRGRVRTAWRTGDGIRYTLELSVQAKSLICDWTSRDARITGLSLGCASGLAGFRLFNVPCLTMGWGTHPAVLYHQGLYCFTLLDWHRTNASQFYGRTDALSDSAGAYNGGSRYLPLTDGTRNRLRERQFLTVSQWFEEVLPNIPNPPSPMAEVTGSHLYCHLGGVAVDRYQKWLETWKQYKEYGIDRVRLSHHEDAWSDGDTAGQGPQEFTMTLDAAPEIGDAQLIDYCRAVRELGWLVGLYSNYTDYSMLAKSWDERNVTKLPSGEWKRAWPPNFNIKPLKAVEMERWYAPRIVRKFGTNTVYCDVHTCVPPWENVDYEAGAPGAGMLATAFRAYGALLLNERVVYGGPVFSEGIHHWFYAGLADGNYGQMGLPDPQRQPFLLDFDLRKIHPLEADVSMLPSWSWGDGLYHLLASQIAYGHIGFLPVADVATAARVYYLMQQLQVRYNQVPVDAILYRAPDGRMLEVSDALPIDAHRENQVSVRYANGLELHVNGNPERRWTVMTGGREYDLSPYAWVAAASDFLQFSTELDGRRINYCDSPVYTYAEAGGFAFDFGPVETSGALVLRKDDARGLKVIPIAGADSAVLRNVSATRVTAFAGDGREIGPGEFEGRDKGALLRFRPGARYFLIE